MMTTCLLKRVLPFTLTFILGVATGGFFKLFGARTYSHAPMMKADAVLLGPNGWEGRGCDYRRRQRDMDYRRRQFEMSESRALVIAHKPNAVYTTEAARRGFNGTVRLSVTFGHEGKVTRVETLKGQSYGLTESASRAAWAIKFTPALEGGIPVEVTRVVEYDFPSEQTVDESAPSDYSAAPRW